MPTHNDHSPNKNEEIDASQGFEQSDVGSRGIIVFLFSLGFFVGVTWGLCYFIGKGLNAHLNREDGPNNKWTQTYDIRQLGNLPSNPAMQNKVAEITQNFPAPRVQVDDGNQDVADLHERENLLLDHYTWVNKSSGRLRIPVERAMEIIVQQNILQVAPSAQTQTPETLMTGDSKPAVAAPLTNGYAPTAYEQEEAAEQQARNPGKPQ
jgi:hypothetical protein